VTPGRREIVRAGRAARLLLFAACALVVCSLSRPASAHSVGVSRGEYRRTPAGLEVSLAFAASEVAPLGGPAQLLQRLQVRAGAPCRGELERAVPLERDGIAITALFRCTGREPVRVSLAPLLHELTHGHRHEAVQSNGASVLLFEAEPELVVSESAASEQSSTPPANILGFVGLGVEHILLGYDHLVFLLGLVVVGLGTRRTIVVASAFTLAHSLSLAATVLGGWTPPSAIIEPAIALSIVYVGVENLLAKGHERRTRLAFAFGLVHGFGFASALADVEFGGRALVGALFGFNAGVELGQLLVLALLLPLVSFVLARPAIARHAVRAVSAGVAASGAVWFFSRVFALA
jgi:hypothetical protein